MKVIAIGVKRMRGIGKDSGREYDFAQVEVLTPLKNTSSDKFTLTGLGYETSKLDMRIEALAAFNDVKFPANVDLLVEHEASRNGMKAIVTGLVAIPSTVKAVA